MEETRQLPAPGIAEMKIRTDFVTNSSSYSSTEIIIDNPVLLELLQKYKDMGVIRDDGIADKGNLGDYRIEPSSTILAYYVKDEGDYEPPKKLDDLLDHLIAYLTASEEGGLLFQQMVAEIKQKEEILRMNYREVSWNYSNWCSDIRESSESLFTYSPESGESYHYEVTSLGENEEDEDEGSLKG